MIEPPQTDYAKSGDLSIAYQVVGDGPPDLLFVGDWGGHVEGQWEEPRFAAFLERLAAMGRLVMFDQRGTGMSDPVPLGNPPTLEQNQDDILAVLDTVGSERAVVVAIGSGAPVSCLLAASHPDRVAGLILINGFARLARAPDHPWGIPRAAQETILREVEAGWAKGGAAEVFAPTLGDDPEFRAWFARYRRVGASPRQGVEGLRTMFETDVRDVLPSITLPVLVLQRIGDLHVRVGHGRHLAEAIDGAVYVELPGRDHFPWVGDADSVLSAIEAVLAGERAVEDAQRIVVTVVFTDIADSTARAAELGDRRWRRLLDDHDEMVRRQLLRFQGTEIKATGDGFLASFDGPTRAIHCASAIRDAARSLGIEVRVGAHTGECDVRGDDLGGIAIHIAARVNALARPGEVLVSSTVKDLVAGSGFRFEDRGEHALKGVPAPWRLYAVAG